MIKVNLAQPKRKQKQKRVPLTSLLLVVGLACLGVKSFAGSSSEDCGRVQSVRAEVGKESSFVLNSSRGSHEFKLKAGSASALNLVSVAYANGLNTCVVSASLDYNDPSVTYANALVLRP